MTNAAVQSFVRISSPKAPRSIRRSFVATVVGVGGLLFLALGFGVAGGWSDNPPANALLQASPDIAFLAKRATAARLADAASFANTVRGQAETQAELTAHSATELARLSAHRPDDAFLANAAQAAMVKADAAANAARRATARADAVAAAAAHARAVVNAAGDTMAAADAALPGHWVVSE